MQPVHTSACENRTYPPHQVSLYVAQRDRSVHPSDQCSHADKLVNIHSHFIPTLLISAAIPVRILVEC